jgi:hypothetical protein
MTCKRLPHTISVGQYSDSGPYVPALKGTVEGWFFFTIPSTGILDDEY